MNNRISTLYTYKCKTCRHTWETPCPPENNPTCPYLLKYYEEHQEDIATHYPVLQKITDVIYRPRRPKKDGQMHESQE